MFFNQNYPKMKLVLQKNAKFSSAGGSAPRPPKQLPHCEFLATRLLCVDADGYASESLINRFLTQERRKERFMLLI